MPCGRLRHNTTIKISYVILKSERNTAFSNSLLFLLAQQVTSSKCNIKETDIRLTVRRFQRKMELFKE